MAKFSELWQEVEKLLSDHNSSGNLLAVIEAHKILEAVLIAKGYPGKSIEEKLFWAGYSGKDKEGISEAISRRNDIISKVDYQFSDFEAQEAVRMYKKVTQEIVAKPKITTQDRIKYYLEIYFSPKSIKLWRNLAIVFGSFITVKILAETQFGKNVIGYVLSVASFVISWSFFAIILIVAAVVTGLKAFLINRSKIKIKE